MKCTYNLECNYDCGLIIGQGIATYNQSGLTFISRVIIRPPRPSVAHQVDVNRLGGRWLMVHILRIHSLESTTILICSVFAVIFWVSSGIGIVFKTVCPTRWSCCMIFYRPAPGSSAFLFIPCVPSNSLHLISTGPFFFPHSLPTSRIRYEIHRFILSIMLTYEIRSLLLFGLKFRTSKNMGFFG